MKKRFFYILLFLCIYSLSSCKTYTTTVIQHPEKIEADLVPLSFFENTRKEDFEKIVVHYDTVGVKKIVRGDRQEFWVSDTKVLDIPKDPKGVCSSIQIFKKNFIVLSKDDCSRASPVYVKRNNVLLIDLHSSKVYKVDFGAVYVSFSKEWIDHFSSGSPNVYAISFVDLDNAKIKIINSNDDIKNIPITATHKKTIDW